MNSSRRDPRPASPPATASHVPRSRAPATSSLSSPRSRAASFSTAVTAPPRTRGGRRREREAQSYEKEGRAAGKIGAAPPQRLGRNQTNRWRPPPPTPSPFSYLVHT